VRKCYKAKEKIKEMGDIEGECSFKGKIYVKRVKTKAKSLRKQ
jgi:hypothetical protein